MKRMSWVLAVGISAGCLALTGCNPTGGLNANFYANVYTGAAPLTVQFTDTSNSGTSPIMAWHWLFGDGTESTEQNPAHTYTADGTYNVSLEVTTSAGNDTKLKMNFITVTTGGDGEGEGEPALTTDTVTLPGNVPLEMVWIPAGSFTMGSPDTEPGHNTTEAPGHAVALDGFWVGKYELTKQQWMTVIGTEPWSGYGDNLSPNSPASFVTWDEVKAFITELNRQTGMTFRLPSEAQWEYACRAGTTTAFYWGDDPNYTDITNYAWYSGNSGEQTHDVGQKIANAFGLYDMSGNMMEWCEDDWHDTYNGAPTGGQAWVDAYRSTYRVARGGNFKDLNRGYDCRSAIRFKGYKNEGKLLDLAFGLGFRLAR